MPLGGSESSQPSRRASWEGSGPNLIDDDHGKRRRMPSGLDADRDRRSKRNPSSTLTGNRTSMGRGIVLHIRVSSRLNTDLRT